MSTPASLSEGAIVDEMEIFRFSNSGIYAATTMLVYAYAITFDHEVRYIWKKPKRPASWIYVLIRYPGLLAQLLNMGLNSYTPNCTSFVRLDDWMTVIALVATYVFQIIRTYAVCSQSRALTCALSLLVLPTITTRSLQAYKDSCEDPYIPPVAEMFVQLTSDIVFESIVVAASVHGTWSRVRLSKSLRISSQNLAESILHNGLLYYGFFILPQVCYLVTYILPGTKTVLLMNLFADDIALPLRWTLSCQFILELRERMEKRSNMSGVTLPTISSIRAAANEDFGEPLVDAPLLTDNAGEGHGFNASSSSDTELTDTMREFAEAMDLRARYLAQCGAADGGIQH